ncbi:MAG: hypothetical protein ACTSXD_13460 [Candidatus Heimdallarchaeaceae archaeon]
MKNKNDDIEEIIMFLHKILEDRIIEKALHYCAMSKPKCHKCYYYDPTIGCKNRAHTIYESNFGYFCKGFKEKEVKKDEI